MKIAVAATLLATASAFSASPQQVRMFLVEFVFSFGFEMAPKTDMPIGVTVQRTKT